MRTNRRSFLQTCLSGAALAACPRLALSQTGNGLFELTAANGQAELHSDGGEPSDLWLYNGQLPGPEIRAPQGSTLRVRFRNELSEPTSIHWHGIRIDNKMDGVAGLTQEPVLPGESFDYEFTAPDAGTFWYHAHVESWNQVPRGLAGPLVIEDSREFFPRKRDLVLALSDWRLTEDGALDLASFGARHDFAHAGRLGNWLTVNGKSLPDISLEKNRWHRLRLINMSAARVLDLAPERFGAMVIALDGQTFDEAREVKGTVQMSPGQRMDLAMRPETTGAIPFEIMTAQPFTFASFQVEETGSESGPALTLPPPNDLPEPDLDRARQVPLVMAGGAMGGMRALVAGGTEQDPRKLMEQGLFWAFNGNPGMPEAAMFSAKRGETIVLESRNETAFPHAIHIHGHHFRILERGGAPVPHKDWLDTFTTRPKETVKIAFVADNPGKWLLHCHMLGHAASGMTTWFEVA